MPPPNTRQITATLYPVARPISARPGQAIMVAAGIVIGVYTGDDVEAEIANDDVEAKPATDVARPAAVALSAPAASRPKPKPKPKRRAPPPPGGRQSSLTTSPRPDERREQLRDHLLRALRETGGPVTAAEVNRRLGYSMVAAGLAYQFRLAVDALVSEGIIAFKGAGPGRTYHLVAAPPDPPSAPDVAAPPEPGPEPEREPDHETDHEAEEAAA